MFSDAWLLFSAFIHKSGKTQIELFSSELLESFGKAIEDHSHSLLLKSVEEVHLNIKN
jgi:dsRNA-specific ribonuclease